MTKMGTDLPPYFPSDYFAARERFIALAHEHGAEHRAYPLAARGPRGETLSIDTAYLGARAPRALLILSSGTHGVEGFAGNALQQLFLAEFADAPWPAHAGILLVHALNPYGFAHLRRVNENNVDLNRNALERFPGPPNFGYRRLHTWLDPLTPPGVLDGFLARGLWHLITMGHDGLAQAVAGGQYEYPRGLFYGGGERQESLQVFESILQDARFAPLNRVLHLDLHTGLGGFGEYRLIVEASPGSSALACWQRWFGAEAIASGLTGSGPAVYTASGTITALTARLLRHTAEVAAAVLEFGTYSAAQVLRVLRCENRLHHFGETRRRRAAHIKAEMLETFFPSDPAWRIALLAGGRRVFARLPGIVTEPFAQGNR